MEDYRLEQSGQEVQDILNGAAMQSDLTAETERATEAEQTLQGNIDIEERDRKAADLTLQGNIDAEELRAKAAEKQNADDIDALEEKVPSGASASNKLATESYVDDSVATATATFRGTYNLVSDLHLTVNATEQQIATALALAISTADNNDYCFVQVPTSSETPTEIKEIDRYKFNGTAWSFEYKLNNSGFTTAQWAAINSGITSGDVSKLAALPTNAELTTLLNGKQDVLTFDNVPTEGSSHPVKSGGVYSAIGDEKTARENADSSLSSAIEAILLLIPSAATSLNKLADKAFVNSSIATASATFRGTYNLVTDLSLTVSATHAQIATALAGAVSDEDNNDYAFVQIPTSDATPTQIAKTERYKFNGTAWEYEYDLNNSGYTAAQWAAINSGITAALVAKLDGLPTNAELTTALGVLTSSITAINQKIPSAASQANQLVDTTAMESYIVQVLDVLTASFNVTSSDGHVTVQISQVDGKITSFALTTIDIASAASLSLVEGRVTTAEGNISTNAADIANLQDAYAALTQSALVIVKPSDTWPVASPATKTIYRVVDRVNTPPQNYSDYMWNGSTMVPMATYDNAIDDVPTAGSDNLVKSGGVYKKFEDIALVRTEPYNGADHWAFSNVLNGKKGYALALNMEYAVLFNDFTSTNINVADNLVHIDCSSNNSSKFYAKGKNGNQGVLIFLDDDYFLSHIVEELEDYTDSKVNGLGTYIIRTQAEAADTWYFDNLLDNKVGYCRILNSNNNVTLFDNYTSTSKIYNGNIFKPIDCSSLSNPRFYKDGVQSGNTLRLEFIDVNCVLGEILDSANAGYSELSTKIDTKISQFDSTLSIPSRGYESMIHKTVKTDGTGDFTNIQQAINSITDASVSKQYVIDVYDDFHITDLKDLWKVSSPTVKNTSDEPADDVALIITKNWVHLRGIGAKKQLYVESPDINMPSNCFQYIQVIKSQGTCIIDNFEVLLKGGRYPIHLESSGIPSSPNYFGTTTYKNLYVEHFGNQEYTYGNGWPLGSCYAQANGTSAGLRQVFENCKFRAIKNIFYTHTNTQSGYNYSGPNELIFNNCIFEYTGNYTLDEVDVSFQDIGSGVKSTVSIINCLLPKFSYAAGSRGVEQQVNITSINSIGAYINGGSNSLIPCINKDELTHVLVFRTKDNNKDISVVGGSAKDLIFGKLLNQYPGASDAKGETYGDRFISDPISWVTNPSQVYTLAHLLGNCASSNKTLIVRVDGTDYTITFDQNFVTTDGSAYTYNTVPAYSNSDIINYINSKYPSIFEVVLGTNQFTAFNECMEVGKNRSGETIFAGDAVCRDYTNGVNSWRLCGQNEKAEGIATERIDDRNNDEYSIGNIILIEKSLFGSTTIGIPSGSPIGTMFKMGSGKHKDWSITTDKTEATFILIDSHYLKAL